MQRSVVAGALKQEVATTAFVFGSRMHVHEAVITAQVGICLRLSCLNNARTGVWGFRTFGRWEMFTLAVTSVVYYVCYHGVLEAAKSGVGGGTYFDILVVCLVGQFVSTFSGYGTYVYLLVSEQYESLVGAGG